MSDLLYLLLRIGGKWEIIASKDPKDEENLITRAKYSTREGTMFDIKVIVPDNKFFVIGLPEFIKSSRYRINRVSLRWNKKGKEEFFALDGKKIIKYPEDEETTETDVNIFPGQVITFLFQDVIGPEMDYHIAMMIGPSSFLHDGVTDTDWLAFLKKIRSGEKPEMERIHAALKELNENNDYNKITDFIYYHNIEGDALFFLISKLLKREDSSGYELFFSDVIVDDDTMEMGKKLELAGKFRNEQRAAGLVIDCRIPLKYSFEILDGAEIFGARKIGLFNLLKEDDELEDEKRQRLREKINPK